MRQISLQVVVPILFGALSLVSPAWAQSIEEMAGQMIVVGFRGDDVGNKAVTALRDDIAAGRLGGVMYLQTNVASLDAVKAMNEAFRDAAPAGLPPFLTLDQEGGYVERLTGEVGFVEVPSAASVAANNDPDGARRIYERMAEGVADAGFTVNFGPVVDLKLNANNQVIAKVGRAFSDDPERVTAYAKQFIDAHHDAGLLTAVKHFPGHGSSTADSHEGYVDITDSWQERELAPYRALIAADEVDFVMVGHLIHRKFSDLPSSLAPEWIDGVLRSDLGFNGVVISDDLEMGAIRDHFDLHDTVVQAVNAGMDVLLFSNTAEPRQSLGPEILKILVDEAAADPAFAARIEQSYRRIVALKQRIGD